MSKSAIIFGHRGQDGRLLSRELLGKGCSVVGISRSEVEVLDSNGDSVRVMDRPVDLTDILSEFKPDKIFYLAANHGSSESRLSSGFLEADFRDYFTGNIEPLFLVANAVERWNPDCFFFYASSALVYEGTPAETVSEISAFCPKSFYGMAKAQGVWLGRKFRQDRGMRFCSGILFNHESHLRSLSFFTSKVINGARRISEGEIDKLELGNLDALVDWGYAPDFIAAFDALADSGLADDFIIATGEAHSSRLFVDLVFREFDLEWSHHVVEKTDNFHARKNLPLADISKIKTSLGWAPSGSFSRTVSKLVADHRRQPLGGGN